MDTATRIAITGAVVVGMAILWVLNERFLMNAPPTSRRRRFLRSAWVWNHERMVRGRRRWTFRIWLMSSAVVLIALAWTALH